MLKVINLAKSYHGVSVLNGASFELKAGECLGLVGPNGSGKSTLMRIVAQIIPPDKGEVQVDGRNVLGDRRFLRQKLGYVPQEMAVAPFMTVAQQLAFWRRAVGSAAPEAEELLGLDALRNKQIADLSGGQCKRVSIAMMMQSHPDYVMMDEALSGLDPMYCQRVVDWLRGRLEKGAAALWCSHNLGEIEPICKNCLVLEAGKLQTASVAQAAEILAKTQEWV